MDDPYNELWHRTLDGNATQAEVETFIAQAQKAFDRLFAGYENDLQQAEQEARRQAQEQHNRQDLKIRANLTAGIMLAKLAKAASIEQLDYSNTISRVIGQAYVHRPDQPLEGIHKWYLGTYRPELFHGKDGYRSISSEIFKVNRTPDAVGTYKAITDQASADHYVATIKQRALDIFFEAFPHRLQFASHYTFLMLDCIYHAKKVVYNCIKQLPPPDPYINVTEFDNQVLDIRKKVKQIRKEQPMLALRTEIDQTQEPQQFKEQCKTYCQRFVDRINETILAQYPGRKRLVIPTNRLEPPIHEVLA